MKSPSMGNLSAAVEMESDARGEPYKAPCLEGKSHRDEIPRDNQFTKRIVTLYTAIHWLDEAEQHNTKNYPHVQGEYNRNNLCSMGYINYREMYTTNSLDHVSDLVPKSQSTYIINH